MKPAPRRRPIPLRRPLGAALALSLVIGPLLSAASARADEGPTVSASQGGSDQPRDRTPRPGPSVPRVVRPQVRAPGVYVVDADAAAGSSTTFGEPSIAINPASPHQIAITRFASAGSAWNNNADLLYSSNGGITWTDEATIPVPPGVADTAGGPCDQTIDYGRNGTLYGTFLTCPPGNVQVVSGSTTDPTKASSWSWNNPTPTTTQLTSGTRTNTDQPWLIVNRDPTTASQDNVYVGYQDFNATSTQPHDRVNVSRGASPVNFPAANDNPAGIGALQDGINGGLRMVPDPRNGTMYALYQEGGSNTVSQPQPVTIRLNRSTDGGANWTLGGNTSGITVASVSSDQGNQGYKFGGVNALIGGVQHAAVDPSNGDVFVAYGVDVSGTNQIRMRRLTDNGAGSLNVGAEVNVSTSTNAALPSVAVLSDGTVGVLYLTNDGNNTSGFPTFSAHLARSTDHGATFTDTVLQTYTTPVGTAGAPRERLFGDYQQLKAVGTTFFGAFVGNLNGVNKTTAQPTDTIFFSVPQATASTLASSANPSVYGQPVAFTATVVPPPDGGTVTFKVDGTQLGSPVPVNTTTGAATSASDSGLSVGPHNVDATYNGDPNYQGDTAMTMVQTVNQAAVTTTLASSANPSGYGQPVTFTDTVCAAPPSTNPTLPPSGTVTFQDGSTLLGTGTLAPGGGAHCAQATLTWSNLLPGTHTITASYGGDGNYLAGSLESLAQTVACTQTVTGTVGTVFATTGSTCVLNATVNGPVLVQPGAAVFVSNSTVMFGISSRGATQFGVCGSRITGAVDVAGTTGFTLIGDPGDDGCAPNRISGNVSLGFNQGGVDLVSNQIGGTVSVSGNTGHGPFPEDNGTELEGNTIGGTLTCSGNNPAPVNGGHPNTVSFGKLGQCSSL